jgi:hypothetical protein
VKLTTDTGLATASGSWDIFLFCRLGRLTGVVMLSSCHFNLTPYPLHVIFNLMQRPQKGFSSSHLYPASLQVQHPVLVRLCVAIGKHESSLLQGYSTSAFIKMIVVRFVTYGGLLESNHRGRPGRRRRNAMECSGIMIKWWRWQSELALALFRVRSKNIISGLLSLASSSSGGR